MPDAVGKDSRGELARAAVGIGEPASKLQPSALPLRDLYGSVFFETANAWNESKFKTNDYKSSVGYELRLSLGSYYLFPTAISLVSAYSLDPVSFVDPGFSIPVVIKQDRGFSYYFTLGFGFDR